MSFLFFLLLRKTSISQSNSVSILKHLKIYDENVNSVCMGPAPVNHQTEMKAMPALLITEWVTTVKPHQLSWFQAKLFKI